MSVKLRHKISTKGEIHYYLDIYHNGNRKRKSLKIQTKKGDSDYKEKKALAERIRAKYELDLSHNEYDLSSLSKKDHDFIIYYQKYIDGYRKKDIRMYRYALAKFIEFLKGESRISMKYITPVLIKDFASFLETHPNLNNSTPSDYLKKFNRVVRRAYDENYFQRNPAENINIKKREDIDLKKRVFLRAELQLLAKTDCGNQEAKRAFLFACYTGLGEAEIRSLIWSDIINDGLAIRRNKTKNQVINKLNSVALKLIGDRGQSDENLFRLASTTAINKALKNWVKKAEIDKNISFYCARHTFAVLLLMNGVNLKTVADLMGHSSTRHTVKYLNFVDSLKENAIDNLPIIDL